MTQHERELSNLSYTNKDFQTIYPELLELAKKLSYKWNPIESDESDPGVVLLKLAALMTDKLNYNIDKNILELYPLSVTQDTNARQLFDQCGYSMKYFQSATTDISFAITTEPDLTENDIAELAPNSSITLEDLTRPVYARSYTLPMFTMVTDVDNNIVYTTLEDAVLKTDSVTVSVPAIQGIIQQYTINGQSIITAANLDYNNRLYFTETDIAENGIFISSNNGYDYNSWKRVDNLILQPMGTPCYKFGLTENGSMCYIEFPSDVDSLIGSGIQINYIRTRGAEGNIGRKRIARFYVDTTATRRFSYESNTTTYQQSVQITSEHVAISNSFAATNGKDPETIDEAYRNYQRVKSTFETLVSLKDYTDFLYTNKNYSNGFVCDRTNDVQSSYKVTENKGSYTRTHSFVKKDDSNEQDELTAFDLRVYGLTYVDNVTTPAGYVKSFTVIEDSESLATDWYQIKVDTRDVKSIQHDFRTYIPERPIMFKNKFPIIAKIIPQYKLVDAQKQDVLAKIQTALCSALNSRQLVFGEEISYDVVYDTIINADPRIKALVLDDLKYETYVVYKDQENEIVEMRIDSNSTQPDDAFEASLWNNFRTEICARCVLAGVTQLLNSRNDFTYTLEQYRPAVHDDVTFISTFFQFEIDNSQNETDFAFIKDNPLSTAESRWWALSEPLRENENVILTAPNLVNDETYSSYCKFIHNIGSGLSKVPRTEENQKTVVTTNGEYRLREGEYIIFFWKTEDNDDIPYTYFKYDHTTKINIISPTFALKYQENPADLPEIPDELFKRLPSGKGTTEYQHVETTSLTDYISQLQGSTYVLTGSNIIYTKKPNSIKITDATVGTRNVYWILNKTVKTTNSLGNTIDAAVLFDEAQTEYTLQSGEYFMYSNASKTHLTMLGSGTKIMRTQSGKSWSVEAIDYDEFISEGVTYLDTKWFEVPSGVDVIAIEMIYHQLGPGNRVKLVTTNVTNTPPNLVTFSNDGIYQGSGKLTFDEYGNVKHIPDQITLEEYDVSYFDEDGNETRLPERHDKDLAWQGRSLLNIDVSPDHPQVLAHGHTIILYDSDGSVVHAFTSNENSIEEVDGNFARHREFLASKELNLVGGAFVDATSISTGGVIQPVSIYAYHKQSDTIENVTFVDSQASIYLGPGSPDNAYKCSVKIPVDVPEGKYILPIVVDTDKVMIDLVFAHSTIEDDVVSHKNLSFGNFGDMKYNKGTHYIAVDVASSGLHAYLEFTNNGEPVTILLEPLYRYEEAFLTSSTNDNDNIELYRQVLQAIQEDVSNESLETKIEKLESELDTATSQTKAEIRTKIRLLQSIIDKSNTEDRKLYVNQIKSTEQQLQTYGKNFINTWRDYLNELIKTNQDNDKLTARLRSIIDAELISLKEELEKEVPDAISACDVILAILNSVMSNIVSENEDSDFLEFVQTHIDDITAGKNSSISILEELESSLEKEKDSLIKFDVENRQLIMTNLMDNLTTLQKSDFTNIVDKVSELDVKHIFNYTNVVPEDILISDPLAAEKFFDSEHVFNPYTIGMWQWTTSKNAPADLIIVDKIK